MNESSIQREEIQVQKAQLEELRAQLTQEHAQELGQLEVQALDKIMRLEHNHEIRLQEQQVQLEELRAKQQAQQQQHERFLAQKQQEHTQSAQFDALTREDGEWSPRSPFNAPEGEISQRFMQMYIEKTRFFDIVLDDNWNLVEILHEREDQRLRDAANNIVRPRKQLDFDEIQKYSKPNNSYEQEVTNMRQKIAKLDNKFQSNIQELQDHLSFLVRSRNRNYVLTELKKLKQLQTTDGVTFPLTTELLIDCWHRDAYI